MSGPLPDFGRKYRALAPALLDRVWREACAIEPRPADALKRAKRALHQLHSAFVEERELDAAELALARLEASGGGDDRAAVEACARAVLARHASTRERLATIAQLHGELRARLGTPASVLDLGCGLQPFALPWMGLPRTTRYHAWEADARMAALVARWFARLGQAGEARAVDLIDGGELPAAEVAWLFKLLPTLERQRSGAAGALLERLAQAGIRAAVLSFPTRSLGARAKGMREQYGRFVDGLLRERCFSEESFELGDEWFVVARRC